jgi:hypothetical protein
MITPKAPVHQFASALEGIAMTSVTSDLERLSLDYYWYSPVLFEQLQHKRGELVVFPETEQAVMQIAAAAATVFDPHRYTIEDGGLKQIDHAQIDFKCIADAMGLMNPGKTRGWTGLEK